MCNRSGKNSCDSQGSNYVFGGTDRKLSVTTKSWTIPFKQSPRRDQYPIR